jgi:hypothetical protein
MLKINNEKRKQFEKHIDKSALNGMFQIKTIEDDNLNIITYEQTTDGPLIIISPNYTYIKNRLYSMFNKEIHSNSKNLKIKTYLTFKYCVDPSSVLEPPISVDDVRYYNTDIITLTSVKKMEQSLDLIMEIFHKYIEEFKKNIITI